MLAPLVVSWLGAVEPTPSERGLLDAWLSERGARASLAAGHGGPAYDAGSVERIEAALENARAAAEAAPDELARAERELLAHPELPQAAWLLAEVHALAAHTSEADAADRETRLGRARALEGGRAPALGSAPSSTSPADAPTLPLEVLAMPVPRPRDAVFIDGLPARRRTLAPGQHHVRLVRRGQLVWAGWSVAGPEPAPRLADPTRACSTLDLVDLEAGPTGPEPAAGVLCQRWAVARPGALGGLEVSVCHTARCQPWQRLGAGPEPGAPVADVRTWPAWLTWTLVGAGAAATAGVVLWQTGAFERSEPGTQFVFTGPSAAAYRF